MSHSEICPICKGSGKSVYINYFVSHFSYFPFTSVPMLYKETTCNGCNGKGWIAVQDLENIKEGE